MLKDTDVETDTFTLSAVLAFFHQSDESRDSSEDEREDDEDNSGENGKKMIVHY